MKRKITRETEILRKARLKKGFSATGGLTLPQSNLFCVKIHARFAFCSPKRLLILAHPTSQHPPKPVFRAFEGQQRTLILYRNQRPYLAKHPYFDTNATGCFFVTN